MAKGKFVKKGKPNFKNNKRKGSFRGNQSNKRKKLDEEIINTGAACHDKEPKNIQTSNAIVEDEEDNNPYVRLLNMFNVAEKKTSVDDESLESGEEENSEEKENTEKDNETDVEDHSSLSNEMQNDEMDQVLDEVDDDYRVHESLSDEDDDNDEDAIKSDPFRVHFEEMLDDDAAYGLLKSKPSQWECEDMEIPHVGKAVVSYPPLLPHSPIPFEVKNLNNCYIGSNLLKQLPVCFDKLPNFSLSTTSKFLSPLQECLFPILNSYRDLYFPLRMHTNGEEIRLLYCLHVLNHIRKTRNRVILHNMKLKEKQKKKKSKKQEEETIEEYRDQGFTRPKVLMLVPFRSCALKIVKTFIQLMQSNNKILVSHKDRFMEEYEGSNENKRGYKPVDFEKTFDGNTNDDFRIGISIAKKTIKLYNQFYSSDIIIASPLGLKNVISPKGKDVGDDKFLSSIEILILDQTDVFLMQNWNDIMLVMSHLNKDPGSVESVQGYDFERVRMWSINGWAKLYRQTLIFSGFQTPEINSVFNKMAINYQGKCSFLPPPVEGSICEVITSILQVFKRFTVDNIQDCPDARFQYFIKRILPVCRNSSSEHILIFISSYFDFVKVRNYFKKEELEFEQICEYTHMEKVSSARQSFFHGRKKYLLFTERFHYYYRYYLRGIHHIIFYDLPINSRFYSELCNMVQDLRRQTVPINASCTTLYCKYDVQKLIGVVGNDRAGHLINSDKDEYSYTSFAK